MPEELTHDELIREQFSMQAARWDTYIREGNNEDILPWIMGNLELRPDMRVLDLAAGTGVVARAIAPHVAEVVAADATPVMVVQGRKLAESEGLTNVSFDETDARRLPYADGSFDIVASRIAMHHFEEPALVLREKIRVCRSGGQVVIIDITTREDTSAAVKHNRLERLRDPSHTQALTGGGLQELAEQGGLEILKASTFEARRDLESWMELTATPPEARATIVEELEQQLAGGPDTGMFPAMEGGVLTFCHRWVMLVCRKP